MCIRTGKSIPRERVNDNYCDCEDDGSDEPETNACPNGVFYCAYQKRYVRIKDELRLCNDSFIGVRKKEIHCCFLTYAL